MKKAGHIQPTLAYRAASGAMWIAVEMASTQILSLLVFAAMARFIMPSDFGLISISYLAIYTFKSLLIDTVVFAVIRKQQPSDLEYTTCFWLTLAFGAVASLVTFLSAGTAERWMSAPHLGDVLRAMSVILLFMGLARTHEMRLTRSFQFRALALRGIVGATLGGGIGIALAVRGYGLAALVVQQIATSVISLSLLWIASSWKPGFRCSAAAAVEMLQFMRTMVPATAISFVSQYFDTFLIAYFFGPASAGIYAIAKRLKLALQTVVGTPISGVIFSTLAEVQDDTARLNEVSQRMIALVSFACAPILVGASGIARQLISIAFGERWDAAAPIFGVLAMGGLLTQLQSFFETLFILKHRQTWTFHILLVYMLIAASLFLFVGRLGSIYLAVPFVIPYAIIVPISAALASGLTGLSLSRWLAAIGPSVVSSGVMFAAIHLIETRTLFLNNLSQAAICVASGAIVYLIAMMLLSPSTVLSTFRTIWALLPQRALPFSARASK
jgi:O-antigen/teichoic acid export membrane protein